jgi:hypothetical protein
MAMTAMISTLEGVSASRVRLVTSGVQLKKDRHAVALL